MADSSLETKQAANMPLTEAQKEKVHASDQRWSDDFAMKVAVGDFREAENERTTNQDWRWKTADELYLAWVVQKYWEGTKVPRSSLGVYTSFEQIESMLPQIMSGIFGSTPWFEAAPRANTTHDWARSAQQTLEGQLEDHYQEELRKTAKSALIYGNGIMSLTYERRIDNIQVPVTYNEPIRKQVLPFLRPVSAGSERRVRWVTVPHRINRPRFKYQSIKDCYPDPQAAGPVVKDMRFFCIRRLMHVDELDRLRNTTGFRIPDAARLTKMATHKPSAQADVTKAVGEVFRRRWWLPANDYTRDPGGKRVEVMAYWTKERLVWVANREVLLYNEFNPYGFIPFYGAVYTDVLDRFWGLAVTDVVEGEQRLQQSIINARVDELALAIHPSTIRKRGRPLHPSQTRRRPGLIVDAEEPSKDIVREKVDNVTQQAFIEVNASDNRVQKITGGSSLALLGTPSQGGNSANRTATGVNQQARATASRIFYVVTNMENMVIVPGLTDAHGMNRRWLDPNQQLEYTDQNSKDRFLIDPLAVINADIRVGMRAGAKMQARSSLFQMFPIIAQIILNPGFLEQLAKTQGKTLDVEELFTMILDATNYYNKRSLFRDLTEEEKAQMNQPAPEEQLRMQMQRERIEGQADIQENKDLASFGREILKQIARGQADGAIEQIRQFSQGGQSGQTQAS